ncbi:MAG: acetylglucosamine-6-sulfatase [Pirellulales bacterium]|nr:acetylglucosamine-6-sulfatase [Pirellulales bacterium]
MRTKCVARCLAVLLWITPAVAWAAAVQDVAALKPEVQTADWAQTWWMPRHEQKLAALKSQETVDLLMIGDSITHGWENGGKKVWDQYYAKRHALNLGFSGDRTEQVLWRLENGEVDGISPKLAIVMIGTNNAGHRQDKPEDTAAGIKAVLEQLRTRLPQTKVLLLAVFPRGEDANDPLRKLNDATSKIIAGYADDEHIFYLDLSGTFLEKNGRLPRSIMPDVLHPNEKGYRLWAEAMEPAVKKLMGEK